VNEQRKEKEYINKHNCTPYEQGKTVEIKELFSHENGNKKFVGNPNDPIEWIKIGKHIDQDAKAIRSMLKSYSHRYKYNSKSKMKVEMIDLGNYKGIEKIIRYFDQANETHFNPEDRNQHQLLYILNLICCHPNFNEYEFQGQTYRGMKMDADDLKQYEIGAKIMTKSLLSTLKERFVAENFATKAKQNADANKMKRSCICIYNIRKAHTALDIENLSVFPYEKEVLLIPYSAFKVVNIQEINKEYGTEIEI
ncbi:unnamed protein product, partial [Didymodactylos carnosus]